MDLPFPLQVIYAGLAGSLLALIVATIQQKWQLRVFFILALRLAIGWHFLFEGMNKVRSYYTGETLTSKVFTSEPYFRESEGPIADLMRKEYVEDPKAKLNALVVPVGAPKTVGELLGSDGETTLRADFAKPGPAKDYARLFTATPAGGNAEDFTIKTVVALPLNGAGGRFLWEYPADTPGRRLIDDKILAALPVGAKQRFDDFGPKIVEKAPDAKKELIGKLLEKNVRDYAEWSVGLTAKESKKKYVSMDVAQSVPARLADYANRQKEVDDFKARRKLDLGRSTLFADLAAAKADAASVRTALVKDAEDMLKDAKTNAAKEAGIDVPEDPKPPASKIADLDFMTMWMLTICGALLIVGFATRIAAVICAGFLAMTYLTYPSFPWLPNPPGTEGNPVFINKNLIEAFALLVIAVHPTGSWMGIDGLVHYLIYGRKTTTTKKFDFKR